MAANRDKSNMDEEGGGTHDDNPMQPDNNGEPFTERNEDSWLDRMTQSFAGVCIGLILFFGSFGLLIWNEGRAVHREQDLQEGLRAVVPVASLQTVDTSMNGRLVYLTGELLTNETVTDPIFQVSGNFIKLHRNAEMWQWKETSKKEKKSTTYSYSKMWSSSIISSGNFHRSGHTNPSQLLVEPLNLEAATAMVGAYTVADTILNQADWYTPWTQDINISNIADASLKSVAKPYGSGGAYFGNNTQTPTIGDTRVKFEVVLPDTVSIVAIQEGNGRLSTFITSRGGELLLMRRGSYSSAELFSEAQSDNETTTWILRGVGFVIMFVGVLLILQPIATFVDVIPFVGDCMEGTLSNCIFPLVAFIITIPLSLFTISLAWIVYRPFVAGIVVAFIVVIGALVVTIVRKNKVSKNDDSSDGVDEGPAPMAIEDDVSIFANTKINDHVAPAPFVPTVYKP